MKRDQVFEFFRRLAEANPSPTTELDYRDPYTLLVAVVLSAQATDASVNIATRPLFARINTPQADGGIRRRIAARRDQDHRPVQHQGEERDRAKPGADRPIRRRSPAHARTTCRPCPASVARPPMSSSTPPGAKRRSPSTPTCSASATAPASRPAKRRTRSRAKLDKIVPAAVPPRRAPLADPARPLHLQGAPARMLALPGDRPLPLQAQNSAAGGAR